MATTYGPEAEFDLPSTPEVADAFRDVGGAVIDDHTHYDGPRTVTAIEIVRGAAWITFARDDEKGSAPKTEIEMRNKGWARLMSAFYRQLREATDHVVDGDEFTIEKATWGDGARWTVEVFFDGGAD